MLTSVLGEHPEVRLLEFLAANQEFDYTITELSRHSGVSRPATYKVVSRFLRMGVLRKTRRVGASQFYALDVGNPVVKPFLDLELAVTPPAAPPTRRRLARKEVRS